MTAAKETINLKVSIDFSRTPGPRTTDEGEFSGEVFRRDVLLPRIKEAMKKGCTLLIDLDGTEGYGTSFLEESFGGLIRHEGLRYSDIVRVIEIKTNEEKYLEDDIFQYMRDAEDEK